MRQKKRENIYKQKQKKIRYFKFLIHFLFEFYIFYYNECCLNKKKTNLKTVKKVESDIVETIKSIKMC